MFNAKHEQYLRDAEKEWSNASGDDYFAADDDSSAEGDLFAADGDESYADDYDMAAGQGVSIADFDRTLTITVVSAAAIPVTAQLFFADVNLFAVNFGNPAGVTVTVSESSYTELLSQTQNSPFKTAGLRVASSNAAQLIQVLSIIKRDAYGQFAQYQLQPQSYFSAMQFQSGIIDIPNYSIEVAGGTQITWTLLAGATVTYTLFAGKRTDITNPLSGKPMKETARGSLPFVQKPTTVVVTGARPKRRLK